jgi:predicted Zn-dependent peptidase
VAGSSHFLEHLLFKGTTTRSALEIATAMDAVGGEMNAFTAKEHTCYYANVLSSDLPLAVTLLSDLVTEACNTAADLESERTVVLEEIAMRDDEPSDAVHDLFAETLFGDTPLGRSVLGTVESIESLTRDDVDGWYRSRYAMPSIVVTAAGRVDHSQVLDLVTAAFGDRLGGEGRPAPLRLGDGAPARPARTTGLISRRTEQTHLLLGTPAMGRLDERRYAAAVLDTAVGGGMSSRLFQEIREKRGLVYSVGSALSHYAGAGAFSVYAGCSKKRVPEVLRLIREELDRVAADGITAEEVARGRGQLKGGMVLGLEDTGSRMSRLGKSELSYGRYEPVRDVLARLDAVDEAQVRAIATELFAQETCLAVVGPYRESDLDRL